MSENLMTPGHRYNTKAFSKGYDEIDWGNDKGSGSTEPEQIMCSTCQHRTTMYRRYSECNYCYAYDKYKGE